MARMAVDRPHEGSCAFSGGDRGQMLAFGTVSAPRRSLAGRAGVAHPILALERHHPNREINDGAGGELVIDVANASIHA